MVDMTFTPDSQFLDYWKGSIPDLVLSAWNSVVCRQRVTRLGVHDTLSVQTKLDISEAIEKWRDILSIQVQLVEGNATGIFTLWDILPTNSVKDFRCVSPEPVMFCLCNRCAVLQGSIPKRIGKYVYRKYHQKLPPEVLSDIGGKMDALKPVTRSYESVSLWIGQISALVGRFQDSKSCFRPGHAYEDAVDYLQEIGWVGIGIKSGQTGSYTNLGRFWYNPYAKVACNVYGDHDLWRKVPDQVVSVVFQQPVWTNPNADSPSVMYLNGDTLFSLNETSSYQFPSINSLEEPEDY